MMSKAPRWHETLVNSKPKQPAPKAAGKEPAALTVPASSGGKQADSKTSVSYGRSKSLGSRVSESTASISKAGDSLKRGSVSQQGHQSTRRVSRPGRQALRLCSSRSFSSLQTSSLIAAPFMKSSRSLSRLDQRSTGDDSDHAVPSSQVKKKQTAGKKAPDSGQQIRDNKDQFYGDEAEKMKTSSSSEQPESSSSLVSTTACHHHCNKVKKQTRDGVHTLCAMTSGMRHNWVQAVLNNVRSSPTADVTSSLSEQKAQLKSQHQDSQSAEGLEKVEHPNSLLQEHNTRGCAEETHEQQKRLQPEAELSSADGSSASSTISSHLSSHLSSPISPSASSARSTVSPPRQVVEGEGVTEASSCIERSGSASSISTTMLSNVEENDTLSSEQQTGQLVKENDLLSNSSSEQALASQRLHKINHDLRLELEAQKSSHEEAREVELRRRVDLLAQQAQLLVTGDATALAQAHIEQDRQQFNEQKMEWERCEASLKSQLSASEEQRKEAVSHFTQLQQELQSYNSLQQEADRLHKHLQEVTTQLQANEEAQAQKEARLEEHLMLLQASQDRERRSLAASLAKAEQHTQDLQKRLDMSELQVDSLNKTETWTRDIEEAQQQLQEELVCTVSAVQKLQEEREQLDQHCQELQNQLCEADEEVSRLQSRLKTDETHYYNLEHSYERVSEELQLALGREQQKDADTQDIREGYERLLDRKEQELSEVLLKMEVLGNSLEETEVKLNDMLKVCSCDFSQQKDKSSEPAQQKEGDTDLLTDRRPKFEHAGDAEKFMSVIQVLESKLYVTEEKLRDIMQRLEEHQSHTSCQDPLLCSQLTQSRATAQHLSLLLHSQAKQSQRFAQETESRCRMLVGRFQIALNIIRACRGRLQAAPINITDFDKQLAAVASCLQQGEKDAEEQQHESFNASKGEDKILNEETLAGAESNSKSPDTLFLEDDVESVGKCLMREVFVVEKMVSVLQSQHGIISLAPGEDDRDLAYRYKSIISQRIALKTEKRTHSGKAECDNNEPLQRVIGGVCAEAELIYAALKFQQQYESTTHVNNQEAEHQRKSLADVNPPELASYEEQVHGEGRGSEGAAKPVERDESNVQKVEAEKDPEWLERLTSRLQRRAKFLRHLCQEVSDGNGVEGSVDDNWENASAADLNWMQEQAKLIYLSDRLHSDLEHQQSEVLQDKLQALCEEQDSTLKDEQQAFNHTLCQLQEDNSVLREELERAEQNIISVETGNQTLLEDIQKIEDYHEERMNKLETGFQEKIRELQQIHEEEMKHVHAYYTKSSKEKQNKTCTETPPFTKTLPEQTAMERKTMLAGGEAAMREAYQKDKLEASCDQGLTAVEEMHKHLIGDLQKQHQAEVAALMKEKEKLLQEETAATMAAIVAMRRAHKQELEKSRHSQIIKESADITQLHVEYEKEIKLMHKELEVLSVQHTQKCLETSQLSQELQEERQSLMQYQKQNQELKKKQRETDEMSQLFSLNGKQSHVSPEVNDFYEMEVILRAREAEMQFLRQEACSLKDELQIARMDKIYAQNKLKALYTKSQDEARQDVQFGTWSLNRDASGQRLEDTVKNTSKAAFKKKTEKSSLTRQIRGVRSKSLKEGLSIQERMKLFESF
ncbi:nuclear mitotic apparatus protein 1 [Cottoperca gobio]|uniref:Nuclear mitotic apparatus protein 1 n=1 Tax=Cottoperca gobio TaxID=56716 RepID=A0A6J2Q592_COTGO|nr:nuclear mitotic apparatus protein 1-like [Cottoperca gobio]